MQTILIAGGTGLIGTRLSPLLKAKGYEVIHLSRKKNLAKTYPAYQWDLNKGFIDEEAIQKADYVVNLAGAGIADARWTKKRKQLVIDSRVKGNELLKKYFETIKMPKAFIASSAIGFYGDRADETVNEKSAAGKEGFLAYSTGIWEQSIHDVAQLDLRTAIIRIGIVLSTVGGALQKMLISFNLRTGAYFGDGSAIYSWIHIDDICEIFIKAIEDEQMKGIYNGVSPNPISVKELVYNIEEALGKKSIIMPAPEFGLRLAMGEMADAVLTSTNVSADKISSAGYEFKFPDNIAALKDLLNRAV